MRNLLHDVACAVRYLRRNLAFSAASIAILALGVGATTTMFSATDALLFRPLPYPDSDRLVSLRAVSPVVGALNERTSAGTLADWQRESSSFEAIAGYRWNTIDVLGSPGAERLHGLFVTPEFFNVFGVELAGRGFVPSDRGARAIVIGHDVWRRRFHADPSVIGTTVPLNVRNFRRVGPTSHVVVGVAAAPARFPPLTTDFQLGLASIEEAIDFWTPEYVAPTDSRDAHELDVVARLRPGVSVAQAQQDMNAVAARQAQRYPQSSGGWRVRVSPLREVIVGRARTGMLLLAAATGVLLLVACTNVAMLLFAHGAKRGREVAIRAALGASRWRIARQLFAEAVLLAVSAGVTGVILSILTLDLVKPWLPVNLPLLREMDVNLTVACFAVMCAMLTACLTGIAPALRVARHDAGELIGRTGAGITLNRQRSSVVRLCVVIEVALALMLCLAAGLLGRSVTRVWQVNPGIDVRNLLTMTVSLPENKFGWNENAVFAREVVRSVTSMASVTAATVIQGLPMRPGSFYSFGKIEGFIPRSDAENPVWRLRVVGSEYFDVMRIPILRGRGFDTRDEQGEVGHTQSVIVSAAFANKYWPHENPLGKRIGSPGRWETVIGVSGDVRYAGLEAEPTVDVYYPQALFPQASITLIARTRGDPLRDAVEVQSRIKAVDRDAFVTDVRAMEDVVAESQAERRAGTLLVAAFNAIAIVLVLAGVYSVIAQSVARRTQEVAIRAALGAGRWSIIVLAVRTVMTSALMGIGIGILGGLVATRAMSSTLFGVSSLDPNTWMGACVMMLLACLSAAYMPARRATRIDPAMALRAE